MPKPHPAHRASGCSFAFCTLCTQDSRANTTFFLSCLRMDAVLRSKRLKTYRISASVTRSLGGRAVLHPDLRVCHRCRRATYQSMVLLSTGKRPVSAPHSVVMLAIVCEESGQQGEPYKTKSTFFAMPCTNGVNKKQSNGVGGTG